MDATTFLQDNPKLVKHLEKAYGDKLERSEIEGEVWFTAATAGARKGKSLTNYICNAVQRRAREGASLLQYTTDHRRNDDGEPVDSNDAFAGEASLLNGDPLDILLAKERVAEIERQYGAIWDVDLEGFDNPGISERGMRKRRAVLSKKQAQVREAQQRDMFEGGDHDS